MNDFERVKEIILTVALAGGMIFFAGSSPAVVHTVDHLASMTASNSMASVASIVTAASQAARNSGQARMRKSHPAAPRAAFAAPSRFAASAHLRPIAPMSQVAF